MSEDPKALCRDLVEEKIIPKTKEDGDSDLVIEEIDLIGSHLDKEIGGLNHSIENGDNTQIRKQTRKRELRLESSKINSMVIPKEKTNMKNKDRLLKIEIAPLKLIMIQFL